ncbi:MAG: acyl-CoA desaturase [Cyanothece sp. SIO2G6]|nr:acyl-CoA desaturase [Cyanothece sp. SIO2G6]
MPSETKVRNSPKFQGKSMTLKNPRLQRIQMIFAYAQTIIPTLAAVVAIALFLTHNVTAIDLSLLVSFYILTMIGLEVGYHRFFSHCSFKAHISIQATLAILGSMGGQAPVIQWAALHRRHHRHSDESDDPHTPYFEGNHDSPWAALKGFWHGHIGWIFVGEVTNSALYCKDWLKSPVISRISRQYLMWVVVGIAIPAALGGILYGSWLGVAKGMLWGGFFRIFLVSNAIWSINSLHHLIGTRPNETGDRSTNIWWLVPFTIGGSWHNNHHAIQSTATTSFHWWQLDPSGWLIRSVAMTGLVWDVKLPTAKMIAAKTTVE